MEQITRFAPRVIYKIINSLAYLTQTISKKMFPNHIGGYFLGKMTACTPTTAARVERWAAERDDTFKRSLGRLKADILRANALVQEANFLAEEMRRNTRFSVTLQIPPQNLSPNRKVG